MQRTWWQKNQISETQGSPDGMPTTNQQLGELRVIIEKEAAILGGRRTDLVRHKAQQMEFRPRKYSLESCELSQEQQRPVIHSGKTTNLARHKAQQMELRPRKLQFIVGGKRTPSFRIMERSKVEQYQQWSEDHHWPRDDSPIWYFSVSVTKQYHLDQCCIVPSTRCPRSAYL